MDRAVKAAQALIDSSPEFVNWLVNKELVTMKPGVRAGSRTWVRRWVAMCIEIGFHQ